MLCKVILSNVATAFILAQYFDIKYLFCETRRIEVSLKSWDLVILPYWSRYCLAGFAAAHDRRTLCRTFQFPDLLNRWNVPREYFHDDYRPLRRLRAFSGLHLHRDWKMYHGSKMGFLFGGRRIERCGKFKCWIPRRWVHNWHFLIILITFLWEHQSDWENEILRRRSESMVV